MQENGAAFAFKAFIAFCLQTATEIVDGLAFVFGTLLDNFAFLMRGGMQLQTNYVSGEDLRKAQITPRSANAAQARAAWDTYSSKSPLPSLPSKLWRETLIL